MAAPTQVLPSWLTLVTTVVTQPDGSVSTSSATLQLPLTYFGPSIPLGSNGVWVFGGLTPPPSASFPSLSPTSSPTLSNPMASSSSQPTSFPPVTPSSTLTSPPSFTPSGSSVASSTASPASSTNMSSSPIAAASQAHGISTSTLGAILGAILGALLLLVLVLIVLLLRRNRRNSPAESKSSSFWNRRTTLLSRRSHQTPIWTGWEMVGPDDLLESGRSGRNSGERTPGEGSPRGSGEEDDPFLTRRGGTDDMTETKSPSATLVSVPVAAAIGSVSSHRSATKVGGPIIPRDVLLRMSEEDPSFGNTSSSQRFGDVRIVQPSPPSAYPGGMEHESPLRPPRPLDPDGLMIGRGLRPSTRASSREGASVRTKTSQNRSLPSEKSLHNVGVADPDADNDGDGDGDHSFNDQESAELLTARRVKVGELGQRARPRPLSGIGSEPGPSRAGAGVGALGLDRLAQLGRFSWFKRLSVAGATSGTGSRRSSRDISTAEEDPYTPAPLRRQSRQGSNPNSPSRPTSRPVSWAPLPTRNSMVDAESGGRLRHDSGVGLLTVPGERPMSTLSAKSAGSISGNTIYHTPTSSVADVTVEGDEEQDDGITMPVPIVYGGVQQRSQQSLPSANVSGPTNRAHSHFVPHRSPTNPPTYDDAMSENNADGGREVDILDIPAPRPASPFSAASERPTFPPGLVPLPTPRAWRDSSSTGDVSGTGTGSGSAGIRIDVLEEEPPVAQEGWRSLATGDAQGSRRMTFGFPMVVQQPTALVSEQGSLHSMRSHLFPSAPMSPIGSAPASSLHTQSGSGSSRPSMSYHSQQPTASSAGSHDHSSAVSSEDRRHHRRRADGTEVLDPPLSAVFSRGFPAHPPTQSRGQSPAAAERQVSPLARAELPDTSTASGTGTVTSSGTVRTNDSVTNSSVTTAMTDPITGTVMHLPRMPWREQQERRDQSRDDPAW
ncbi:hypothetical protein OBBRIDRAFT_788867 [Obba rivulosa]|uniref:Uncharacterized protein n=1 Tax=Obba rivulosa TaxID=1052685 RepID=A0A8E2DS79_9APHY|nr:hypothetical protein OBBRIDRAFT_788867 [Obba rivulosa]